MASEIGLRTQKAKQQIAPPDRQSCFWQLKGGSGADGVEGSWVMA
jgi:hypothetical protein